MTQILRSPRHGCFRLRTNHWGSYIAPCDDPEADAELTEAVLRDALKEFAVPDDLPRIPADLWQRWVQLAFHFAPKVRAHSLEVGVRILVSVSDPSKYRMLVPRQSVSAGSVHANNFDDSIDLVTGEKITAYPPDGWIPCGSSHSHGTMGAFFSSVDDGNELGDPGLHITVGSINPEKLTYDLVASITANRVRYRLPWQKFVDPEPLQVSFHPDVLEYVKDQPPKGSKIPSIYDGNASTRWPYGYGWGGQRMDQRSYAGNPSYSWTPTGRRLYGDEPARPWSELTREEQDALLASYRQPAAAGSGKGKAPQERRRRQRTSTKGKKRSRSSSPIGIYDFPTEDILDAVLDVFGAALTNSGGDCSKDVLLHFKKVAEIKDIIEEIDDALLDMATAHGIDPEGINGLFGNLDEDVFMEILGRQALASVQQEGNQLLLLPAGIDSDAENDSHDP